MVVSPFGEAGKRMGVSTDGERLVAIDGRSLPVEMPKRAAAISGPDRAWVTLTLRRDDGALHRVRVMRSQIYERQALAGSGLDLGTRRTASFLLDLLSSLSR